MIDRLADHFRLPSQVQEQEHHKNKISCILALENWQSIFSCPFYEQSNFISPLVGGWIFNRQHREWVAGFIVAVVLFVVVYYTLGASCEELELHKRLMAPTRFSRFSAHHCPQINCKRE